jgi:3-phenylpropionate/trans-cinnamate dioxygenase ferredoxin subunit
MEVRIASTAHLPPGKMMGIESSGKAILLANVNGKYYAIKDICTHAGCKLSEGTLNGEKVRCPCHGSTFDVRTGKVLRGPTNTPEASFNLRIDGDQILMNTSEMASTEIVT